MAGLLDEIIDLFFGRGVTIKFDLGSGYDDMADKEARRARLKAVCDEVLSAEAYKPSGGVTHCNQAVRHIASFMGCEEFSADMDANAQVSHVQALWKKATAEEAQAHAESGGLAVAAKEFPVHGHIAVVYPSGSCATSGSWGKKVPWLANVGKTNGVMKCSEGFPVASGEPGYYLWQA